MRSRFRRWPVSCLPPMTAPGEHVVGNGHFVVGPIVLLKHGSAAGAAPGFWLLTSLYVLGAALFSYLLFGPGPRSR